MGIQPSINQVSFFGIIKSVSHKPHSILCWQFEVEVESNNRSEATLTCGVGESIHGQAIQSATPNKDWVLATGKIRRGGFITIRELCVVNNFEKTSFALHHVALMGQITSINSLPTSVYSWQFDIALYPEYRDGDVEAVLTCGIGQQSDHIPLIRNANVGQWATVQGKIRTGGFIQVRSMSVFDVSQKEHSESTKSG